jgi:hypothetical protein
VRAGSQRLPILIAALIPFTAILAESCTLNTRGELELDGVPESDASGKHDAFETGDSLTTEPAIETSGEQPTPKPDADVDVEPDGGSDLDGPSEEATADEPVDPCSLLSFSYDFEAGPQGFTHVPTSGIASDDPWQLGTAASIVCHSGTQCWNTASTGGYSSCQTAQLVSPTLDLSACAASASSLALSFWHYYRFEPYTYNLWPDGGLVQISSDDGVTWADVAPNPPYQGVINGGYAGSSCSCTPIPDVAGHPGWSGVIPGGAWVQAKVEIDPSHRVPKFRFRFLFGADCGTSDVGWFIDDARISTQ